MVFVIGSGLLQHPPAAGGGGGGSSAAYTNFAARYGSAPDATHDNAYGTFLDGLTTDGFFDGSGNTTYFDFLYLFATDTKERGKINLVSSNFTCTENGTIGFTANDGIFSSSSSYYDTGWNPAGSSLYALSNLSLGIFVINNRTTQNATIPIGTKGPTDNDTSQILPYYTGAGSQSHWMLNAVNAAGLNHGASSRGLFYGQRTADLNANKANHTANGTFTTATGGVVNSRSSDNLFICARNNNGTADSHCADTIAAAWGGAAFDVNSSTTTKRDQFAARLNTYLTDISASFHW